MALATVKTKVHNAIFAAKDNVIFLREVLAVKSVIASIERDPEKVELEPDQSKFSGNAENLRMTT